MIISGKELSARLRKSLAECTTELKNKYGRCPHLAVILVGENPASQSYVRGKILAATEVGIQSDLITLPEEVSEAELLQRISLLNEDEGIDGILVQLPLPKHISEDKVIAAIALEKDVDGFHPLNVARLWLGEQCILPCTPKGIMRLIAESGISCEGKRAVVVGRSNIVGQPMAKLLLNANATVTVAHSRTANLGEVTREADILVVAVGRAGVISADMVKAGAVVIDVGVNRNPETGKLCGDVRFDECVSKVAAITPVPGGVGPMTITMLMENTIECFINRQK